MYRMGNLKDKNFFFPLDYENKLQYQLDKYFTIESHPLLYRHTMGSKIANVILKNYTVVLTLTKSNIYPL